MENWIFGRILNLPPWTSNNHETSWEKVGKVNREMEREKGRETMSKTITQMREKMASENRAESGKEEEIRQIPRGPKSST